jgi:hypothetical protein
MQGNSDFLRFLFGYGDCLLLIIIIWLGTLMDEHFYVEIIGVL